MSARAMWRPAVRVIPELLEDADQLTTEPALPATNPFSDIPRPVWIAFLSAWAVLFALFIAFFGTDGPATFMVFTAAFFALMTLGLPAALGGLSAHPPPQSSRVIMTRTGPLPVAAVATQILLIPVGAVFGLIAFIILAL